MAGASGKSGTATYEYEVGLSPAAVHVKTAEEEETLHKDFFKLLAEFNNNPVLKTNMNSYLHTKVSNISLRYSSGDQFVTALLSFSSPDDKKKMEKLMEEDAVSKFFTDYLESIGVGTTLGMNPSEEVQIYAFNVTKNTQSGTEGKIHNKKELKKVEIQTEVDVNNKSSQQTEEKKPVEKAVGNLEVMPVLHKHDHSSSKKEVLKLGPLNIQMRQSLLRIYVPVDRNQINDVSIIWNGKCHQAVHIPNSNIWTSTISYFDERCEFLIEMSFVTTSGYFIFKTFQENLLQSNIIKPFEDKTIHHLIFPYYSDPRISENAFIEFCAYILNQGVSYSSNASYLELEAMLSRTVLSPDGDINVGFKSVISYKPVLKSIFGMLGKSTHNLALLCYFLHLYRKQFPSTQITDVIDKSMAGVMLEQFQYLQPTSCIAMYRGKIGLVLENIYCQACDQKASVIGFMQITYNFLGNDYMIELVQRIVTKKVFGIKIYVDSDKENLCKVMTFLYSQGQMTLLEKLLRHLPDCCQFDDYIYLANVLMKMSNEKENTEASEKVLTVCRNCCQQQLLRVLKIGGIKQLICAWKLIKTLPESVYCSLLQCVEKGIIDSFGSSGMVGLFEDVKMDFVNLVIEEPVFEQNEAKMNFLVKCSDVKNARIVRDCVLVFLADKKFESLPADDYHATVVTWLKNSLAAIKSKYGSEERIVKIYEYMFDLTNLPLVKQLPNLVSAVDKQVFSVVEHYSIKELMRTVPRLDSHEELQKLFQDHIRKILHGKHSKKSPKEIIHDICGTEKLRVNSRFTADILKNIIDLFDINKETTQIDTLEKAVDHARFWIELFEATGSSSVIKGLLKYQPCQQVMEALQQTRQMLSIGQISQIQLRRMKNNEGEMLMLLSSTGNDSKQKVQESWMRCFKAFDKFMGDISEVEETFKTLKKRVQNDHQPVTIDETLDYLIAIRTQVEKEEIVVADLKDKVSRNEIADLADHCRLLRTPFKSQMFWYTLQEELRQRHIMGNMEVIQTYAEEPLDGVSLPEMFECEYETEITTTFQVKSAVGFIKEMSNNCVDKYRQIWMPFFKKENMPFEEFIRYFAKFRTVNEMNNEIAIGEEFCRNKLSKETKNTLLSFAEVTKYRKTVDAVQISSKLFKVKGNTEAYTEVVRSFHSFFDHKKGTSPNLEDKTFHDMATVLHKVDEIRDFVSSEVTEVLEVVKNSTQLLNFLEEVLDEDIRNLIDAVEEHSEQFVRESTVSDLIEVKRFFFPILKRTYGEAFSDFFALLSKQLKGGFSNIPAKIEDCMENLHTLKALYKNVANRGERTKEIIDSIVDRGKFIFHVSDTVCETVVRYKQDKKTASHSSADLSDLRSRALLLMNAEDRDSTRSKTRKRKEDLQKFLSLVDTAFDAENLCLELRQTGHFKFIYFERSLEHKDLQAFKEELEHQLDEWTKNIAQCRQKYYYMNYIYPAQLQQLFEFLCKGTSNEQQVKTICQFIDAEFNDVSLMKSYFESLDQTHDIITILHNISATIQHCFKDHHSLEKPFPLQGRKAKITDLVQPGIPYIAALDQGSRLVIRTMFALYMNTTHKLPLANQVLFCREETSIDEIDLIIQRCIQLQSQEHEAPLYCIAHVEMLQHGVQAQLVEKLRHLPSGEYLLALVCCGYSHHPFLDQFSDKLSYPTPLSETLLKECFKTQWPHVYVVSSDVPGVGKTEYIQQKARSNSMSVSTLQVSGRIDTTSIISNLHSLGIKRYNTLHIDIGITSTPSELDAVLFQLITLGHLSTGTTAFTLTTSHVYIEIANTVGHNLCNSLPTTTCFQRINLEWNNYQNMRVSTEKNSPVQVVCHYLKALEDGTLDRKDIYLTGNDTVLPLTPKECIPLLQKWFSTSGDLSYTMLQMFVSVLSDQLKKLSASVFFRTSSITDMVGEGKISPVKSQLVRAMIVASQEFACRSVQSCKSLQEASMASSNKELVKEMTSAEELAKRVSGMIRWEDSNHLMILFHQNVQTVSALYREISKIPKDIKTLFESQIKRTLDDYRNKSQKELQDILLKIARQSSQSLSDEVLEKMSAEYALTPDNLLKMILITLRVNSTLPVVIMGETGCGKTSLVRYLAKFCDVDFVLMSIHAGTEETQIITKINELDTRARSSLTKRFWLFLDEINTCDHLGLINNIVCHRSIQNVTLSPNVTVIAACNPYRLRSHSTILTAGLQGKVKTDELSRLVYRVHPLPETMIDFVWDYGSLNEKDEEFYISKMIANLKYEKTVPDYQRTLTELLAKSQSFVRTREDSDCSVSLRDVDRCRKLVSWFQDFLKKKKTITTFSYGIDMKAIVLALAITYHSRFVATEIRSEYRNMISKIVSKYHQSMKPETVLQIIREEQNDILDRMVLPPGIAKNTALQENVFVVLICILNRIPIFLVGKPGCSKSLSIQLIRSNLRGKDSRDDLFQEMPQLFCVSFQGSESSTSDGIIKVFEKAENYQKHNEKDVISVVILDEIGLAEVSRFNPLKVLHGLLEPGPRQNPNVAVVGISNWALDAAKMNRAVHLSRPDMDQDELKYTGNSIIKAIIDSGENEWDQDDFYIRTKLKSLKSILDEIAVGYFKYVTGRQKFENFHGLRDFYSLIKYLGSCCEQLLLQQIDSELVLRGIARNFGGLPTEIENIISVFQETFCFQEQTLAPVADLIRDNLEDSSCRHLMLITNGDSVISVLESQLNASNRPFEIIFGSHFEDDLSDDYNYRILSRIILCMEQGLVLILKGLESIYGSLYDMLNQNYTVVGNKKNCRIALGHYSNPMCHVNDSFKCIVLVEEAKLDYSDPPFLNRFEKQQFKFLDMVEDNDLQDLANSIEETCRALCTVDGCQFTPHSEIPSYSRDLIVSLLLFVKRDCPTAKLNTKGLFKRAMQVLLWTLPPEVIVRAKESKLYLEDAGMVETITDEFFELPLHSGLAVCLGSLLEKSNDKMNDINPIYRSGCGLVLCYTYTNIHCNIRSCFENYSHQCERLSKFKSEKQFSNTLEDFFASEKLLFVLQCSATHDNQHLLLCKVIIESSRRKQPDSQKHVCIVVHLDRNIGCEKQHVPINYLSGWHIIFLDSIEKPISDVKHFNDCSQFEIVKERVPLTSYMIDNLFWALTRIKFTSKSNSVENQTKLIEKIRHNEHFLSTVEILVLKWIEEQTFEDSHMWSIKVAKSTHSLYCSGSFVSALENSITDVIKTPMAMHIYRMLELQLITPVFVTDKNSEQRVKIWIDVVLSDDYAGIKDVPPVTGPECYACSYQFNSLRMPLSAFFMNKIGTQRDEFMEIIRKIRVHNDIEEDEEFPNELLLKTATECVDIVCNEVDDIYKVVYEGMQEDFFHDFCNVKSAEFLDHQDEEKATEMFRWAVLQLLPTDHGVTDILSYIAVLHATYWVNSTAIAYICNLLSKAENVVTISYSSEDYEQDVEDTIGSICIESMSITDLIDRICLQLLQTRNLFLTSSVDEWLHTTTSIVPVAKQVNYYANYLPALQVFQDLMNLIRNNSSFDFEKIHLLGDILQENEGQISSHESFKLVIDIIRELSTTNAPEQCSVQKVLCSYILRCLQAQPDDDKMLKTALEMIENGDVFEEKLEYFGKITAFAVMIDNAEDVDMAKKIILDEIEYPPFCSCFDDFVKNVDVSCGSANVVTKLLIDAVETSCLNNMFPDDILRHIDSATHDIIICLMKACDVLQEGDISFRYITSVAYIRRFIDWFSQLSLSGEYEQDDFAIVAQHLNVLFTDLEKNPYFIYFLKMLSKKVGALRLDRCLEQHQQMLPATTSIKWNVHYQAASITMNCLGLYCNKGDQDAIINMVDNILEKENKLLYEYLNTADSQKQLMLLGVVNRKFYMRRAVKELNDSESRMASEVNKVISESNLPNVTKQVAKHLLGEQEFGHDLFALSETTSDTSIRIAALLAHMCCLTAACADNKSAWYVNLLRPSKESMYIFPCSKANKALDARYAVLKLLNTLVLVGAVGFHLEPTHHFESLFGSDQHGSLQNELLVILEELETLLVMNSNDTCELLHVIIRSCSTLITGQSDMSYIGTDELENRFLKAVDTVLEKRWHHLYDVKRKMFEISEIGECLEAYVDESDRNAEVYKSSFEIEEVPPETLSESIEDVSEESDQSVPTDSDTTIDDGSCKTNMLLNLFRKTNIPSKESLITELYLCGRQQFPFLQLVFDNINKLSLPQHVCPLMKWHLSVVANASYKFRRVDFDGLTVQKYFSEEKDDNKRNLLKKHFDQFKKSWNEIKDTCSGEISKEIVDHMMTMTHTVKMEECTISRKDSILLRLLEELVDIHNKFLLKATSILPKDDGIEEDQHYVSLLDLQASSLVAFKWKENWLNFCQCDAVIGQQINYDFEKIEQEVKNDVLFGRLIIEFPKGFSSPVFADDLYQNSVQLLVEIESEIPQQNLTVEIRKSVQVKKDRDTAFVTDLLSYLGMTMSLLKKTGGDANQPFIEYLEKWQSVTGMTSSLFKRILPEPIDAVRLGHVVTLYQWLEELNGTTLVDTLDEVYRTPMPTDAKDLFKKAKKNHMAHFEKLQHPLMVFVHRCLSLQKNDIQPDHSLIDYIKFSDLWWKEDFEDGEILAGVDKKKLILSEFLSPLLAIEHVYETVVFVQDAVKEARDFDERISSISTDFQKKKSSQPNPSTRRNAARKFRI